MTEFYLVRHGHNEWIGKGIAGRLPGVHLSAEGLKQAEKVAAYLSRFSVQHIFSSPLERALETAEPLARLLKLNVQILEEVLEVDFGSWNGRTFEELKGVEEWRLWNSFRSGSRIPKGESMLEVQVRVVHALERLRDTYPNQKIAIFSHGDPIRAAVLFWLGIPLELVHRIEVGLASITTLRLGREGVQLDNLNLTLDL